MFVFGVFLVHIFPHLEWIHRDTKYLSVFSPNAEKYGVKWLRIRTLFTQWEFIVIKKKWRSSSRGVLKKEVFLKILQISWENTFARVSLLKKLQAPWSILPATNRKRGNVNLSNVLQRSLTDNCLLHPM